MTNERPVKSYWRLQLFPNWRVRHHWKKSKEWHSRLFSMETMFLLFSRKALARDCSSNHQASIFGKRLSFSKQFPMTAVQRVNKLSGATIYQTGGTQKTCLLNILSSTNPLAVSQGDSPGNNPEESLSGLDTRFGVQPMYQYSPDTVLTWTLLHEIQLKACCTLAPPKSLRMLSQLVRVLCM